MRVVAGVVVRDGHVLVARRGPLMRNAGRWELPGGKVEAGEADEAALARELDEELALAVAVHERVGEVRHGAIVLVAYRCSADGEPVAREHDRLRWLGPEELPTMAWTEADRGLLAGVADLLRGAQRLSGNFAASPLTRPADA